MNFTKKTLINGQSLIDFSIQEYGCYEGLFLIMADNPDLLTAISQILPPGTQLKIRNELPALTEDCKSVVVSYISQAVEVACGCKEDSESVFKSITMGEAIVDCTGANMNIPITLVGLDANGEVNVHLSFDNGLTWMTNWGVFFGVFENIPISHTGQGLGNGNYILKLQSVEDPTVESNVISFEINCPFERSIVDLDAVFTPEPNATGAPVDVAINFKLIDGYDGTNPVGWLGTETFQLQHDDGMGGWIDAGSPISNSGDTVQDVQLPNGEYEFRLVCVEYSVVSTNVNTGVGFGHSRAMANFSLNIGSDGSNDGLLYKVTIDGVEYTVNGDLSMTGIKDMQVAMKALLDANTQGFTVDEFFDNGSPSNYFFKISAPIGTNATWNGKTIRVECGNTESTVQGYNITVNGVYSPALGGIAGFGTAPGEGTFTGGY